MGERDRLPVARFKVQRVTTKVVDAVGGRVHAIVSTEDKDRMGDVIRQSGWDLSEFLKHPILLSSHEYGSLRSQIGEWEEMGVKHKRLEGVAHYYIGEGNPEADWAFNLATKGRAAYSVGFRPDMAKAVQLEGDADSFFGGPWEYKAQELLEVSQVTVPANPNALQQMKAMQGLHPAVVQMADELLQEMKMEEETTVQTLILSKTTFETEAEASAWVRENDFKIPSGGSDETEDSWRYRQREPGDFAEGSFRTIDLTTGVKAVIGHLKALKSVRLQAADREIIIADVMAGLRPEVAALIAKEVWEARRAVESFGLGTRSAIEDGIREVLRI